ncbi:hypothetical protein PV646_43950 [Streptomyces sp. ID05-26A]|nr:hypothetical protein [Streptomyces sp. ID05-26A]
MTPFAGLPVVGGLVELLDTAIAQLEFPLWLRGFLEFVLLAVLGYLLLRFLARRVLPWVGSLLVAPVVWLIDGLRVVLLLPDLVMAQLVRRGFDRVPPEVVYAYGSVVMAATDGLQELARKALPALAITQRVHGLLLAGLLVAGFLVWNSEECGPGPECVSPVTQWTTSFPTSQP